MPRFHLRFPAYAVALIFTFCASARALTGHYKGEDCVRCHAGIRDSAASAAWKKSPETLRRRQVVVVGAGIAGLSTAHFLRDLDVLVLEKEDKPGGHARREYYPNGPYPIAAVYLDKPYGPIQQILDDVKLVPSPIQAPAETLSYGAQTISEWLSTGVGEFPADVRPEMMKLSSSLTEISKRNLTVPIQDSDPEVLASYEGITFAEYLEKIGPLSLKIGDMFAKDMFGAGAKDVSALMGLLYIMDMINPTGFSWPGGLGAFTEALAEELGDRVQTGAMVVAVRQSPTGAKVEFLQDGLLHSVEADAVVFATHMLVTSRIAKDLSSEKMAAAAKIRYSSYATVSLSFSTPVWSQSYSLWNTDTFFTDITFPTQNNSHFPGTDKMPGQIGVAYIPLGASHDQGRSYMLDTDDAGIVRRVKADLEKVLPGAGAKITDARVVRWGHAMPVMGPHYFRDIRPILAKPEKRYFFAGEDTQAPLLEGAVFSGYYAASDARKLLAH